MMWQMAFCAVSLVACMAVAAYLVWRHEGPGGAGTDSTAERRPGIVFEDELWRPCLGSSHPAWLLAYRLLAFLLSSFVAVLAVCRDQTILFYYTEWTLMLVAIYFGVGTAFSINACSKLVGSRVSEAPTDVEHGTDIEPSSGGEGGTREVAGFWGYLLQILYQTSAGAVMLTDCVFWLIISPILVIRNENLNLLKITMHSVNVVFLLGEAALNTLRFPWFQIAYFFIWTTFYVIFQWIVHASTPSMWWPYQFLNLSSSLAPLWYFTAGLMHFPCFMVFKVLINLKNMWR